MSSSATRRRTGHWLKVCQKSLRNKGLDVWWDIELVGGEQFREAITKELDAATAVVVIWTMDSIQSRFVIDEADVAASMGKLISVLPAGFPPTKIPIGFRTFQTVPLSDSLRLERALQKRGVAFRKEQLEGSVYATIDEEALEEEAWRFVISRRDNKLVADFLKRFPNSKRILTAKVRGDLMSQYSKWMRLTMGMCVISGVAAGIITWNGWIGLGGSIIGLIAGAAIATILWGDPNSKLGDQEKHEL